jgi:5-formyltetrahydrofolate cyclo-ligase
MNMPDDKRRARSEAAKRRAEAHRLLHQAAGLALAQRGLPFARQAQQRTISGFFPYKSEISLLPLLARLHGEGWVTAMPVVIDEGLPLVFRAWGPGEPTLPGIWDIPAPLEAAPEVLPDVLLVPMLAFDHRGYRLGYGGGFYDRTLAKLRGLKTVTAIGVAYAAQEMPEVPHGEFDQPLDWIMTEKATTKCG